MTDEQYRRRLTALGYRKREMGLTMLSGTPRLAVTSHPDGARQVVPVPLAGGTLIGHVVEVVDFVDVVDPRHRRVMVVMVQSPDGDTVEVPIMLGDIYPFLKNPL